VQSSTLLLLSCRGELPRLDAAIFADTQYEPAAVYDHLAWLEEVARGAGIPVYRVTAGDIRADALRSTMRGRLDEGTRAVAMPFFVARKPGAEGSPMMRRQCTREYKLEPIRRKLRALAGIAPGETVGSRLTVEQWVGISADELQRIRASRDYWILLRYPLVFDLQPAWRRSDCVAWLRRNYPERRVPRSACIGCPFHSNAEWRAMRDCDPVSWADAVAFDAAMRKRGGEHGRLYVHASLAPLERAPLNDPDPRQGSLFSCGVCDT